MRGCWRALRVACAVTLVVGSRWVTAASWNGWDVDAQVVTSLIGVGGSGASELAAHTKGQLGLSQRIDMGGAERQHWMGALRWEAASSSCRPSEFCGTAPKVDASAVWAYSHYARGRWQLGRQPSIISGVTEAASAYAGDSVGSDRCLTLLATECKRLRPFSAVWHLPAWGAWAPSLQISTGDGPSTWSTRLKADVYTGRIVVGYARSSDESWVLPLGVELPVGRWRMQALLTQGSKDREYASVALSTPWAGGEVRVQVAEWSLPGEPRSEARKVTAGYQRAWSRDRTLFANLSEVRKISAGRQGALDVGLRWVLP